MKLVIHPPIEDKRLERVREAAGSMHVVNCQSTADVRREMPDADAFFGKITPEFLRHAKQLAWVQSPTASLEHFLFPELIEHPCVLSNMRGLFNDVIADHVLGYVLCIARNLHIYLRQQRQGLWAPVGGEAERTSFAVGPGVESEIDRRHLHLPDCTLGVVGVGEIGREICRRAAAFQMRVLGVDPVCRSVPGVVEDVWPSDRLDELLSVSDFVVIAAPHTPQTAGLFNAERLAQMKRTAWLINIGRGAIVKLADLTAALQQGVIAGAALDVFETEPLPKNHPLWRMENVILTPHIAAASTRVPQRHLELLLDNIRRFVAGEPPLTVVDKRRWF